MTVGCQHNKMAVNFLRKIGAKVSNHILAFARQTAIHGPKYCINRGTIKGSADVETGKSRKIKISRFDRLVDFVTSNVIIIMIN